MPLIVENENIILSAAKKRDDADGYVFRLFNGSSGRAKTRLSLGGVSISLSFESFEVKTVCYDDGALMEKDELII